MNYFSSILLLFLVHFSYGQNTGRLSVDVSKAASENDSFLIYNVSIQNYNDSVVCILHSHFILLSVGNKPQSLAATETDDVKECYNLKQAARDTLFTYEVPQYRASIILPYQGLNFGIHIPSSNKDKFLSIDYVRLYNIDYRKFQKETMFGRWYEKYSVISQTIEIGK